MAKFRPRSKVVRAHLPCPDCGSSDARAEYKDGGSHCFSCGKTRKNTTDDSVVGYTEEGGRRKKVARDDTFRLTNAQDWYIMGGIGEERDVDSTLGTHIPEGDVYVPPSEERRTLGTSTLGNIYNIYNNNIPKVQIPKGTLGTVPKVLDSNKSEDFKTPEENYFMGSSSVSTEASASVPSVGRGRRGITPDTLDFFGVYTNEYGNIVYPYGPNAAKMRQSEKDKNLWVAGEFQDAGLFGMDKFNAGSSISITITEGEDDAMSAFQMLGSKYPVVSIKSGSKGARRDCEAHFDYLNSFDKIYLCFDNDKPGKEALIEAAAVFNPNKVYVVQLTKHKDANEYLKNGDAQEFVRTWWNSKRHRPKGILSGYDEIAELLDKKDADAVAEYPFPTMNDMTLGIRLAEVNLVTAKSGTGKTEILRSIEHKVLKDTDFNIAVIHLEERDKRAIQGLATYELGVPAHRPDSGVSKEDVLEAFKKLTRRDDRVYFYQHFGSEDPNVILDVIRYLVTVNHCRFVFLDHITMLVTGHEGDDERKKLDYLSTQLATLTRELDFTLFLVSHINENGGTRGSKNIENISDLWLHVDRDKEHADPEVRNTLKVMIKKNRFGSDTGPGGILKFDRKTFTLSEPEVLKYVNTEVSKASEDKAEDAGQSLHFGNTNPERVDRPPVVEFKKLV